MTKRKFIKILRANGWNENDLRIFVDTVAKYKGRLSYSRMMLLLYVAFGFGRRDALDMVAYVDAVMTE